MGNKKSFLKGFALGYLVTLALACGWVVVGQISLEYDKSKVFVFSLVFTSILFAGISIGKELTRVTTYKALLYEDGTLVTNEELR